MCGPLCFICHTTGGIVKTTTKTDGMPIFFCFCSHVRHTHPRISFFVPQCSVSMLHAFDHTLLLGSKQSTWPSRRRQTCTHICIDRNPKPSDRTGTPREINRHLGGDRQLVFARKLPSTNTRCRERTKLALAPRNKRFRCTPCDRAASGPTDNNN